MITGIVASILYLIYRVSFPSAAELGRDDTTGDFETIRWEYGHRKGTGDTDAHEMPGIIVYRFNAPLIFSNAEAFEAGAKNLLIEAAAKDALPTHPGARLRS